MELFLERFEIEGDFRTLLMVCNGIVALNFEDGAKKIKLGLCD